MHVKGQGLPQDFVQAYRWFNIAATLGDEMAKLGLKNAASGMTPDRIAGAERLAGEWLEEHQR